MAEPVSEGVVGALVKPATVLIERISDAVGSGFKPMQIRRIAKAEADADLIRLKANISKLDLISSLPPDLDPSVERAVKSMIFKQLKELGRVEAVTSVAAERLKPDARPEEIDEDLLQLTVDKVKSTSSERFQDLWATLLAQEANEPGSFSKRTINILAELGRDDAFFFEEICSNVFDFDGHSMLFLPHNVQSELSLDRYPQLEKMLHLSSAGLIEKFSQPVVFRWERYSKGMALTITGVSGAMEVNFLDNEEKPSFDIGPYMLSRSGVELSRIVSAKPSLIAFESLTSIVTDQGWTFKTVERA